jgi:predicted type IV restriction endonuclease
MGLLDKIFSGGISDVVKSVGDVVDNLTTTNEEKEKLKIELTKVVQDHEAKLKELANSETETYLKDMDSARNANVQIQESDKASWLSKNVANFIDIMLTLTWCGFTLYLGGRAIKLVTAPVDLTAVLSIYSTVTAVFMMTVSFWRGSSRSSEKSGDAIRRIAEK